VAQNVSTPLWHSRGYIPHWEAGEVAQSITFRLADSLPAALLERWQVEHAALTGPVRDEARRKRVEQALDSGLGSGALAMPEIGELVENALLCFDGQRYRLHAWSIMPNHVHVLITPLGAHTLSAIVHSWKSFTAKKANAMRGSSGAFWAQEYFDRAIRDDGHYANTVEYFAQNPVKAGLCGRADDWRYASAWGGRAAR
jgi:REP element-mobilizing transposase RayT